MLSADINVHGSIFLEAKKKMVFQWTCHFIRFLGQQKKFLGLSRSAMESCRQVSYPTRKKYLPYCSWNSRRNVSNHTFSKRGWIKLPLAVLGQQCNNNSSSQQAAHVLSHPVSANLQTQSIKHVCTSVESLGRNWNSVYLCFLKRQGHTVFTGTDTSMKGSQSPTRCG